MSKLMSRYHALLSLSNARMDYGAHGQGLFVSFSFSKHCWHHGQQMVASSDGQFELHQAYNSFEEFEIAFEVWKRKGCHPMRTESSNILRELDPATNQRFRYSTIKFVCVHFGKPRVRGLGIRPHVKPRQQGCDVMVRVKYYVDCGKLHITRLVDKHNHETSPELYRMLTQSSLPVERDDKTNKSNQSITQSWM